MTIPLLKHTHTHMTYDVAGIDAAIHMYIIYMLHIYTYGLAVSIVAQQRSLKGTDMCKYPICLGSN